MPPFEYRPFVNPYTASIGELLLHQGDIAAHAAEAKGQAYAQAFKSVGDTIGAIPQQQAQANVQGQETQLRGLQIDQAKQQQGDIRAYDAASAPAQGPLQPGETPARPTREQILAALPGHMQAKAQADFNEIDASASRAQQAQIEADKSAGSYVGDLAVKIRAYGYDPSVAALAIQHARETFKNNPVLQQHIDAFAQQLGQNPTPDAIRQAVAPLIPPQLMKLGEGDTVTDINSGKVVAQGGQKPPTEAELALRASGGDAKGAMALLKPPPRDGYEQKSVLLDGKPAMVNYDNKTGKSLDAAGNDVSARVRPIPPAAIQVNAAATSALSNLPAWATDDSRPSGPTANKLDPLVRMTPNGLYQSALTYIATGQYPPNGRGSDASSQMIRASINSKVGAIAAASGMDEPALRAFYKSNAASLTQEQKLYDAAQANITTADRNVAQLEPYLKKLPDVGSPLLNQPLRAFEKSVAGNPDMGPIATYLASVQNEYGKIINSSNGGAVLTDSARHEAQTLIDPNATVAQIIGSIQALKTEGGNRLLSVGDQIQRIQQRMTTPPGATPASTPASTPATPADGTRGSVNGVPAVWKTVNGRAGWYKQ